MCLVGPAIVAGADETEVERLKGIAYHLGQIYQLKDDLLDLEGAVESTGKSPGIDAKNGKESLASMFGPEQTRNVIAAHEQQARTLIGQLPKNQRAFDTLLQYISERKGYL